MLHIYLYQNPVPFNTNYYATTLHHKHHSRERSGHPDSIYFDAEGYPSPTAHYWETPEAAKAFLGSVIDNPAIIAFSPSYVALNNCPCGKCEHVDVSIDN